MSCQEPPALNHLQGWRLSNSSDQPVTVLSHPHSKNPNVSSRSVSLVFQSVPIAALNLLVTPLLRQPRTPLFLFYHKGSWLARVHLVAPQHRPVLQTPPPGRQPFWFTGLFLPTCSTFHAFILVELHEAPASPLFQPVRDSLDCTTTLWCTGRSTQFGVISKPAQGTDCPRTQTIDEHVEEDWTSTDPRRTMMVSGLQLDFVTLISTLFNPSSLCAQPAPTPLFSLRILWHTFSKALLKSREAISFAFSSSTMLGFFHRGKKTVPAASRDQRSLKTTANQASD